HGAPGIEHNARRLAAACGEHHDARVDGYFGTRFLVDVGDAFGESVRSDDNFTHHRAGAYFEIAGLQRRRDVHAGRRKVGIHSTGAPALGAIVAGGPAVVGPGQNRQARGDAGNLQFVGDFLDDLLVRARRGRRQELSVGRVFQTLVAAEYTDQFLRLVVVGREIFVGDGPIEALAVAAVGLEVVRAHAERDAPA